MAWATIMIMKKGLEVQMAVELNEYYDNENQLQSTIIER